VLGTGLLDVHGGRLGLVQLALRLLHDVGSLALLGGSRGNEVDVLHNFLASTSLLELLDVAHTASVEALLASGSDLLDLLHGLECLHHEVAIVLDRSVAAFLEVESGIHGHFLAARFPVRLGPLDLAWVAFELEALVALRSTKLKHLAVITDKGDTVTGVHRSYLFPNASAANQQQIFAHRKEDILPEIARSSRGSRGSKLTRRPSPKQYQAAPSTNTSKTIQKAV